MTRFFVALILLAWLSASHAQTPPPLGTTQYTYKLSLLIDFKKREKILKANGEEPSAFDTALSKFSSAIHAADVVDTVERKANQLKITSVTSLVIVPYDLPPFALPLISWKSGLRLI
jgi:hypothetical protein